jgi:hypothetical protein
VIRAADGFSYGRTPLTLPLPQSNGILKLLLRLDGYQETPLLLDLAFDNKQPNKPIKQSINLPRERAVKVKEKEPANREAPVEPAKQGAKEAPKEAAPEPPKEAPKDPAKEAPKEAPKLTPLKEALKPAADVTAPR